MARFALNPDYRDFLSECNAQNVEYLVIGGQAVIFYGYVRNTKDLDVWINPTAENAKRIYAAIAASETMTADTEAQSNSSPRYLASHFCVRFSSYSRKIAHRHIKEPLCRSMSAPPAYDLAIFSSTQLL